MQQPECGMTFYSILKKTNQMKKTGSLGGVVLGIFFTCFVAQASAQYTTALGVRVGGTTGLTFKHQFKRNTAFEVIVGTFANGFSLTALLEKQKSLGIEGLYLYYGGGPHVATYDGSDSQNLGRDIHANYAEGLGVGINGIVGLEYRLPNNIPIAFSLDSKPFVEFGQRNSVGFAFDPSISIKFVIL
jgi:hypothetical protein